MPSPRSRVSSPGKQVVAFIAKFDAAVAKLARASRSKMRKRLPTAVELVYDNYNGLAIGYGPTEKTSHAVLSLAVYAKGVHLYFLYGASLADPDGVLEGEGSRGRFIRLSSAAMLDDPIVSKFVDAAIARAAVPFAPSGRGYTVVKSVSKKQRPRQSSSRA